MKPAIRYVCGHCGYTIYVFQPRGGSIPSAAMVARIVGVCPRCGASLETVNVRVNVRPRLRQGEKNA